VLPPDFAVALAIFTVAFVFVVALGFAVAPVFAVALVFAVAPVFAVARVFVAHALVRAASRLVSTLLLVRQVPSRSN
jgi:hypothetical protein